MNIQDEFRVDNLLEQFKRKMEMKHLKQSLAIAIKQCDLLEENRLATLIQERRIEFNHITG